MRAVWSAWRWRNAGVVATLSAASVLVMASLPRFARATVLPAPAAGSARPLQRALVAQTLNVFGLPWPVGRDVAQRSARIAVAIVGTAPDFVALQEVWDDVARTPLLAALRDDGYHAAFCESPQGLLGQSGLLTLSRHPIVHAAAFCFTGASGIEALTGKGALCTVVALPDGSRLAIWNVHLQSGSDGDAVRGEQIRELAGWIRSAPERCRVVLGDFNCAPGDREWNDLELELGSLGLVRRSGDEPTYDHRHNPLAACEPPAAIDHVFVDASLHAGAAPARRFHDAPRDGVFVSDHFGLEVRLPLAVLAVER